MEARCILVQIAFLLSILKTANELIHDFWVLVEAGTFDEARKLFDKMLNYGVVISVDSLNFLIWVFVGTLHHNISTHILCRLGKLKEAHSLLLEMESKGCLPDVISYSTPVDGYCRAGKLQMALGLIREMGLKGFKPNAFTYSSIIVFLCKNNQAVEAERRLREMMTHGIAPDN
ncbi:hypothetical protein NE237_011633 [Protea cynaroides]|uniref:Pentatricopeptide repeat-containing protein n=1 Tax=Protea cynaroides TaxID=273540 RepID=A0A9Q0GYK3_9MAGN|nr:hypothetical protein NE237_011633 [Protea cynaroides]